MQYQNNFEWNCSRWLKLHFFLLFIQPIGLGFLHFFLLKNIGHKKLGELTILHVNDDNFFFEITAEEVKSGCINTIRDGKCYPFLLI
jgi:hypothetical protein